MRVLTFDELPQGGFAGLREKRFVTDSRVFGGRKDPATAEGIGNFVYLADANFMPNGETGMHPHREIDVISIMIEGRINHAGSLQHGQSLETGTVQVQRAGGEGFTHNEINPDAHENQMIQLWVLPDESGEPAAYKVYQLPADGRIHVYGGPKDQDDTFHSNTSIDVISAKSGQTFSHDGEVMAYLAKGDGVMNGESISARTLLGSVGLQFVAESDAVLIVIFPA